MELIFAGFFIIIFALIGKKSSITHNFKSDSPKNMARQYLFMVFLGGILVMVGVIGIGAGIYSLSFGSREILTLIALILAVNLQARLAIYGAINNQGTEYLRSHTTIVELVSKAMSIGLFPNGGIYCLFVNVTQILIFLLILSIIIY